MCSDEDACLLYMQLDYDIVGRKINCCTMIGIEDDGDDDDENGDDDDDDDDDVLE